MSSKKAAPSTAVPGTEKSTWKSFNWNAVGILCLLILPAVLGGVLSVQYLKYFPRLKSAYYYLHL